MADYATVEEIQAFAEEPSALGSDAWDLIATSASRLFDKLTEVPDDFYAAAGEEATTRTYYGDGTAYLKVDPFLSTPTPLVEVPGGEYTIDAADITAKDAMIVFLAKTMKTPISEYPPYNRYTGWYDAVPVEVEAIWGFAEIPSEVKYATIQIALTLWRQREPAAAVTSGIDGVITFNLPKTAQMVVDKYRAIYSRKVLFG